MTDTVEVPDPEPDWLSALEYKGSPNPTRQYFTFEQAIGDFRDIAGLRVDLAEIGRRLRLKLEPGDSNIGPVEAAFFSINRIGFAAYRYTPNGFTVITLHRTEEKEPIEALDVLLVALGIDWRAVGTVLVGHGSHQQFIEPVLDSDLRPTFPGNADETDGSGSGT